MHYSSCEPIISTIMKIIGLLVLGYLSWPSSVQAQERQYKSFKVEIAGGVAIPTSGRVGYLVSLEPKYAINEQISVGLRNESFTVFQKPFGNLSTIGTLTVRSYSLTSDRYFNLAGRKRLSAGVAVGIYQYARGTANREDYKPLTHGDFSPIQLGLAPRIGLELSHLRLGLEYNFMLDQPDQSINYFSAKVGLIIGGGKYQNRY